MAIVTKLKSVRPDNKCNCAEVKRLKQLLAVATSPKGRIFGVQFIPGAKGTFRLVATDPDGDETRMSLAIAQQMAIALFGRYDAKQKPADKPGEPKS